MSDILKNMAPLFEDLEPQIRSFKKDAYEGLFNAYMERNHSFFEELNRMLAAEDNDVFIQEFTGEVIAYARELINAAGNKVKKESMQLNLNMFMAIYFLPAVLEGKQEKAKALAERVCDAWALEFRGNNIKSAEYRDIQAGFRSKLCYVTTAVCRSLNKPEDCYELNLLKNYRDSYLTHTDNGEALVMEYYNIAPTIVKRIDKSDNPGEKYRNIWEEYLKPCIAFIENGENEECSRTYIRMVEELRRQYLFTADAE